VKAATSTDIFTLLLDAFYYGDVNPICKVQYLGDDYIWHDLEDVMQVSISKKSVDNRWNAFSLLPPISDMSVSMSNATQKYSDASGTAFEGILTRNRKLRCSLGYRIKTDTVQYEILSMATEAGTYYNTKLLNGILMTDPSAPHVGAPDVKLVPGWTLYDSGTYDSGTYSGEGYYITRVMHYRDIESVKVLADNANIKVYFRSSSSSRGILNKAFTLLGNVIANAETEFVTSNPSDARYFQVAIVFETSTWGLGGVTSITLGHYYHDELFQQGLYLADDPGFTAAAKGYYASFSARSYLKRALETKVSLQNYTTVDIMEIVRRAATKAGIPWNATDLPSVGITVSIPSTQPFHNVTAQSVFDECITYIAAMSASNYRLYENDDGELVLGIKPLTAANADLSLHYEDNLFSTSKQKSSNNLLQRATAMKTEAVMNDVIQLADTTLTTAADHVVSLSNEAIYKDVEIYYQASDASVEASIIDSSLNSITIRITGTGTISVRVIVEGCRFSGSRPYAGEIFSSVNHIIAHPEQGVNASIQRREGITHKFINRFIASDANAKDIATKLMSEWGNKKYQLSVTVWGMPWVEVNDKHTIFEKYAQTNSIFIVEDISQTFNSNGANFRTTINYIDLGFFLSDYIWDRNGWEEGDLDILFDRGMIWDQDLVGADPETYENTREVRFS